MLDINPFIPFIGVVESIDDPENMGRVQVRCYGFHDANKARIPTDDLRWFYCLTNNSASVSGIGETPTGYVPGSTVFGYFLDQRLQDGFIVGSFSGKPNHYAFTNQGFNDPSGEFPRYVNESDVNRLAREDGQDHWLYNLKENARFKQIQGPLKKGKWDEPPYKNNAIYPNNFVRETRSGHVREYDDTPSNERIHEYHRSGTYKEVGPTGDASTKVVGNNYELIAGDDYVYVRGTVNLTIDADVNMYVKGDMNTQIDGNKKEVVLGSVEEYYGTHYNQASNGTTINTNSHTVNANNIGMYANRIDGDSGGPSYRNVQVTIPASYDVEFAAPVIEKAGRYAPFDDTIELTPDDYPEDNTPESDTGEVKEEADVTEQEQPTGELGDCMEIETPINYNMMLSDNYSIADLSTNALFGHSIKAQAGFTEQEIVCNLQALAENIIEPLRAEFGSFSINSGFRPGSGSSDHHKGMAVDIQNTAWPYSKSIELCEWINNNLAFDTLILEWGNHFWLHITFDRTKSTQRGRLLTMYKGNYEKGIKQYYS